MAFEDLTDEEIDQLAAQVQKDTALSAQKSRADRLSGYSSSIVKGMGGIGAPMGSGQMAGRVFVPAGPGQALAQGLRGYAAGKLDQKAGVEEENIGLQQGEISAAFLRSMIKAMRKRKAATPAPNIIEETPPEGGYSGME
jgi:hypothetical protein